MNPRSVIYITEKMQTVNLTLEGATLSRKIHCLEGCSCAAASLAERLDIARIIAQAAFTLPGYPPGISDYQRVISRKASNTLLEN